MITVLVLVAIFVVIDAIDRLFFRKERRLRRRAMSAVYWLRVPTREKNRDDLEAIEEYCNYTGNPYEAIETSRDEVAQWYRDLNPELVNVA